MLNYIWAAMIILGVIFGAVTGNMKEVTEAALDSAGEAVSLCITMAGVMALWVGLMEVAEKSGLLLKLTRGLSPFISFMFPRIPYFGIRLGLYACGSEGYGRTGKVGGGERKSSLWGQWR